MVDFNTNFRASLRPTGSMQSTALRGGQVPQAPTGPMAPVRTPRSQAEIDALRNMQEAQASQAAQQRLNQERWRGRGVIGAPIASFLQGRRENKLLEPYAQQEMQRLEQAAALQDMQSQRQFTDESNVSMFENALDMQRDTANREGDQSFEQYMAEVERGQDQADATVERAQELQDADTARQQQLEDITARNTREDELLAAEIARDDALSAEEQERIQQTANNARTWSQLAEDNEDFDIYFSRYNELKAALPTLARMAGVSGEAEMNPLRQDEQAWNWLKRNTGGTGFLSGSGLFDWIKQRPETQRISQLANSEVLNKLGTLDVPLTPVSDPDIKLVMGTGISTALDEQTNYDSALTAIANLEQEMEHLALQAARMSPVQNPGTLPPGVTSIEVIE